LFSVLTDFFSCLNSLSCSRQQLRDRDRRDESGGRACALVKQRFAQALLEMLPLIQSAASMAALGNAILEASEKLPTVSSQDESESKSAAAAPTPSRRVNSKSSSSADPLSNRKNAPASASKSSTTSSSSASTTSSITRDWQSASSFSTIDTFAARVARAKSIMRFGHPQLALNSDALAVAAAGPASVLQSLGPNFTTMDASSRNIFSTMFSSTSSHQHPALDPSLGGAAVPLALNSLFVPFSAHDTLLFDPIREQMLAGEL
jgi:hypothetical protein